MRLSSNFLQAEAGLCAPSSPVLARTFSEESCEIRSSIQLHNFLAACSQRLEHGTEKNLHAHIIIDLLNAAIAAAGISKYNQVTWKQPQKLASHLNSKFQLPKEFSE